MKRWLVVAVTFLGGLYFFVEFFLPEHIIVGRMDFQWNRFDNEVNLGLRAMWAAGLGLGIINLIRVHGYAVVRRRQNWPHSMALLTSMLVATVSGFWWYFGESEGARDFFWKFLFSGLMNNLAPAMFSLLAFYIASAAYRSFRVQNMEAGLMMLAALLVMLGQIPLGFFMHEKIPVMRNWLLTKVSTPAFRGIFFGAAIAGLAMAVRMWLSLERTGSRGGA